jgi:hypothetical protein
MISSGGAFIDQCVKRRFTKTCGDLLTKVAFLVSRLYFVTASHKAAKLAVAPSGYNLDSVGNDQCFEIRRAVEIANVCE